MARKKSKAKKVATALLATVVLLGHLRVKIFYLSKM